LQEFNRNPRLASRVIGQYVIGLRSDIEVPEVFLGHFRYCNGFSILTTPYKVPIGLARFLASIWITDPHSLWLSESGTLKKILRKIPTRFIGSYPDKSNFTFESDSDDE
jgi:hypothetical protein